MKKILVLIMVASILIFAMTGCVGSKDVDNDKYNVVTTTTFVTDLAQSIGGQHVNIQGLMGAGLDPHLYQASAGDVLLMQNADMVIYHGLHLEGKLGDVFENIENSNKMIMAATEDIDESKLIVSDDFDTFDPHIWFDVSLWKEAAKTITEGLKELDQEHSKDFDDNLEKYLVELDELENYINQRVSEIPQENRVLITAHDAFAYFGSAFGFEVKGLQGISTDSEAGTSDVRQLSNFIVDREIKAVFVESSVPPKSIEALQEAVKAQGFDVEIGGELYSDSTGDIGTDAETYIGTFKANVDTIIDALK